jgi:hypothetical protein
MASQEHLDILKQGVDVWNQWRTEHSELRPNLSRVNLTGALQLHLLPQQEKTSEDKKSFMNNILSM